jgi:hypothetical protein
MVKDFHRKQSQNQNYTIREFPSLLNTEARHENHIQLFCFQRIAGNGSRNV